jgi:ACS family pantothenate transporter-like MFS transporter
MVSYYYASFMALAERELVELSVGAHFIYGLWYKKSELGTRAAVFVCFGHLGSMAGGWIQAGLLESLAGKNGLPAWQWIFIIVSVITIPTAAFGKFEST